MSDTMSRSELEAHLSHIIDERIGQIVTRNGRVMWSGIATLVVSGFWLGSYLQNLITEMNSLRASIIALDKNGSDALKTHIGISNQQNSSQDSILAAINATLQLLLEDRRRGKE